MKPSGAHTHPEMGGGGSTAALLVVLAVVVVAIAEPVAHAASDVLHVVGVVLEVMAVVICSVVALAAMAGLVYLVARLRHHHLRQMAASPVRRTGIGRSRPVELRTEQPYRYRLNAEKPATADSTVIDAADRFNRQPPSAD